jgi:hypothetical protein
VRQAIFQFAGSHQPPFKLGRTTLRRQWNMLYQRTILSAGDYEDTTDDELQDKIRKQWDAFRENELPKITNALEGWLKQQDAMRAATSPPIASPEGQGGPL